MGKTKNSDKCGGCGKPWSQCTCPPLRVTLIALAVGALIALAACGEERHTICTHPTAGVEHCVDVTPAP